MTDIDSTPREAYVNSIVCQVTGNYKWAGKRRIVARERGFDKSVQYALLTLTNLTDGVYELHISVNLRKQNKTTN